MEDLRSDEASPPGRRGRAQHLALEPETRTTDPTLLPS